MISKLVKFCKLARRQGGDNGKEIYLAAVIVLVAVISFGLGRLSKIREEKMPITIENIATSTETVASAISPISSKIFVASRNGKKYYYAWCDSANVIKEQNRIWFSTQKEAESAGYEPAANCKGLK